MRTGGRDRLVEYGNIYGDWMMLTGGWTTSPDVTMLVGFHGLWCGIARVKAEFQQGEKAALKI